MGITRRFVTASCLTILGLLFVPIASGCAPAAAPTPAPKAPTPAPAATKAPAPTATAAAPTTAKPAAPTAKPALLTASPKPAAGEPRYGGTLTIGVGGDPPGLDVHREETAFSFSVLAGAYNGLVRYDPQAWPQVKVIPDLATSWELSPDGTTYTFHVAKGVKFHDGGPLTAEDVKFSFDRIRDPKMGLARSPRRGQLSNVTNIEIPDDSTVKITLGHPQASFLNFIAAFYFAVVPKRVVLERNNDLSKTVMGTGAFKFKDYASGVGWELVKNADYFVKGHPYLDGVKGYIIRDSFTRFAALRTKSILWLAPFPYMTVSQSKIIEETLSDKIAVTWEFHAAWYGMVFSLAKQPWNDARVRRAVSMSFDRKNMLALGLEGAGVVGMSAQAKGEWALPEEEMVKVPGYAKPDLEGARKLMAEAGFPNGFRTEAMVRLTPVNQALGEVVKNAASAIGITVDLDPQESTVYLDRRFRRVFTSLTDAFGSSNTDPDILLSDFYLTNGTNNFSGYSNPVYDDLYGKQSRALDTEERRKIVWEMQRILLQDVPIAIAYWARIPYARWTEVRGYAPPSISHHHAYGYREIWLAR
ncbi:MAG: hypothetical protein HYX92_05870 [Chloroflexi bacterium]|nr:hypothetical protein [Chloroflexota bacterium]